MTLPDFAGPNSGRAMEQRDADQGAASNPKPSLLTSVVYNRLQPLARAKQHIGLDIILEAVEWRG